jgi:hypothetical protein
MLDYKQLECDLIDYTKSKIGNINDRKIILHHKPLYFKYEPQSRPNFDNWTSKLGGQNNYFYGYIYCPPIWLEDPLVDGSVTKFQFQNQLEQNYIDWNNMEVVANLLVPQLFTEFEYIVETNNDMSNFYPIFHGVELIINQ